MTQICDTTDTSREAHDVQLELVGQMSPIERLKKTFALSRQVRRMSMDAIRRRHPEFDENMVHLKFIELTYGEDLADGVRRLQQANCSRKERAIG